MNKKQSLVKKDLDLILQEGEGLKIEFKERFNPKDMAKEMVAFANSEGGRIFLGVKDSGEVKGIDINNKIKSQIQDIANNCDPKLDIDIGTIDSENILIVNVKEGEDKPYRCSLGFFIRIGANSQKMKRDEIINFVSSLEKISFEEKINNEFDFKKDFDKEEFDRFVNKLGLNYSSREDVLVNLSLAKKDGNKMKFNNAGVLLFGKNPSKFLRQNFVTCVLYKGKKKVDVIDRKDFEGNLFNNYENALGFLKQHLKLKYIIEGGGPRKEVLELPEPALREALLNSIIHRDYSDKKTGVFVEIFDDRVEIYNKGELLFDKKYLGRRSVPRNPRIFDIFYRMNLIERIGSGINRIRKEIEQRGLNVKFNSDDFFEVIFRKPSEEKWRKELGGKTKEGLGEKLGEKLGENQRNILSCVIDDKYISIPKISKKVGISTTAVEKNIVKLKQKGLLKRVGAAKGGYWEITIDSNENSDKINQGKEKNES